MAACFNDVALIHNDDPVHFAQCRKTVRDGQTGLAFHYPLQCSLDCRLNLTVQCAGGLIKNQNRRVF